MAFVDRAEIFVKGGDGGNGMRSFRREKYVPKGGPDGGTGGRGGDVILKAIAGTNSLAELSFRRHWKAPVGENGGPKNMTGRDAHDLVIAVPPGTVVRDREHQFVIKDMSQADSSLVIARGGRGGRGNASFMTSTNQAPRTVELGQPGEERWVTLELKVIADVGIVGMPNAGKSTLLSRLSRARPEIADYPFTTKFPNLGILYFDPDRSCVLADIPGLIEGASEGIGLGHEFLRHVERTRLLVHLVECLPPDGDPVEHYRTIRREMELYNPRLAAKPEVVALSKRELLDAEALTEVQGRLSEAAGKPVLLLSAVTGEGLPELVRQLSDRLAAADQAPAAPDRTAADSPLVATLSADMRVPPQVAGVTPPASQGAPAAGDPGLR